MTRQRSAVADVLADTEDFRSAQQLHELIRERGHGVGLATVYRTLQTLAEGGEVDVLRTAEGEALYRRCARRSHHHHLICRDCGATVEIDVPTLEAWSAELARAHGYRDIEHTVELWGTCAECTSRGAREQAGGPDEAGAAGEAVR